jgi:hypothetical protein
MVRIAVEVADGTAHYEVAVQADSIRRALEIAEELGLGSDIKVRFPIDPETFFVKDPAAKAGLATSFLPSAIGSPGTLIGDRAHAMAG